MDDATAHVTACGLAKLFDHMTCAHEKHGALRYDKRSRRVGERNTKILIVEDDTPSAEAISALLELEGFVVRRASDALEAMDSARTFTPDVVLVDLQLPFIDGRSFIELYRRGVHPAASIIVMSGREDASRVASSLRADAFVAKPFDVADLLRAISLTLSAA